MGHQGLFSRNNTKKRNRLKHTQNGLCISCSKKVVANKMMCEYHLKKAREYNNLPEVKIRVKENNERPEVVARRKEWLLNNIEKTKIYSKTYYQKNKEKIKQKKLENKFTNS